MSIIKRFFGMPTSDAGRVTFAVDPITVAAAQRVVMGGHCACLSSRSKKGTPSVPNPHVEERTFKRQGGNFFST